ncbi:MAG: alpha/beta hydrolase [Pseudomonadales bacterium]|nr:alpha/beta hydrolase [Pseudomonadales bacterium]
MKQLVLILFVFLFSCQPSTNVGTGSSLQDTEAEESTNEIVIGTIDTIESGILGENRDLWIYLPRSAQNGTKPQLFPVVYLLDGNGHFHSVSGMIRQLSAVNGNRIVPEMIVVGIPNTDRMRDLSPTHTTGTTGVGTAFLDFISNEVIPHVEENYPASQYRTFVGHSLGGLMAIEALITRPEEFANYVAIDPSLWWDDQSILLRAEAALNELDFTDKSLYVSIANTLPSDMSVEEIDGDTQELTEHIRSIFQFARSAESNTSNGLNFDWRYYDDDSHGSVPLISEYDAFRFLFPWYDPGMEVIEMIGSDSAETPEAAVSATVSHFENVSAQYGYNYLPPLNWVNRLGTGFLAVEKPASALAMFQLNLSNFPDSPLTHESLGVYFVAQEDQASARLHFQHAIDRGAEIDIEEKLATPYVSAIEMAAQLEEQEEKNP